MRNPDPGYLAEIPYPPQFFREHAPLWLRAVLAALGHRAPDGDGTSWCELGCGSGIGVLILAATNSSTTFHGIDVRPDHIEQALALADKAGIANVRFHCVDLRDAGNFPPFDYIVARGVYSWVSPEVRKAIRGFAGRHLKPGGVAMLHYLALPGAADFMAFHGLFRALRGEADATARSAVAAGHEVLSRLADGRAGFFASHPAAQRMAQQIASDDPDYTAHDYLNEHYVPLASAQVIAAMRQEGLEFIGSAAPFDNLDDFSVPEGLRPLFAAQRSVAMRETVRDLASNQESRIDLYTRSPEPLTPDRHLAALRRLRFRTLPGTPARGGLAFAARIGKVEGPAEIFSPILERFAATGAAAYADIEALPGIGGNPAIANQALHAMMGSGSIHPLPDVASAPGPAQRLNDVLLELCLSGRRIPALASSSLASGLSLSPRDLDEIESTGRPPARLQHLLS